MKIEEEDHHHHHQQQASSALAAPSLISAITQAAVDNKAPVLQSLLEDGHVFMPPMPADLQAELASSASSSFNGVATFGVMQQQLLSTFDGSPMLAGDFAADLFSSPSFTVTDGMTNSNPGGDLPATEAAAAVSVAAVTAATMSNMETASPIVNTAAFNAAAGVYASHTMSAVSPAKQPTCFVFRLCCLMLEPLSHVCACMVASLHVCMKLGRKSPERSLILECIGACRARLCSCTALMND